MGKVALRGVKSSANPARERSKWLSRSVRGGGAEAALCPPRQPPAHVAVDFGSGARGAEDGPRGLRAGVCGHRGGWTAVGNPWPKIRGALSGTKMMGIWMLVPRGLFRARI